MSASATSAWVPDTASGALVLRVCGSSRHGQIVRLSSAKCTIGSGPRSTLRLRARGVQPTHCLIVRGSHSTVIRRWSPDTRLNGRAFADAELAEGDRLGIGTIELEVLDAGRLPSGAPVAGREAPSQRPPSPQPPGPCQPDGQEVDRLATRLRLANRQGRQRVRRLLERLRLANGELERLRQSPAEPPELRSQPSEQIQRLNTGWDDLDRQREALESERRAWHAQLAEAREQITQQGERLHADQAEFETQQEEFQRCRRQWEEGQAAVASPPRPEELPVGSPEPPPPEPQETPSKGPIDIAEVFRRMRSGGSSSAQQESSVEAGPRPSGPRTASRPSPPLRPAREHEEESIEDYMSRLLDRVSAVKGDAQRQERQPQGPQPEPPFEQPVEGLSEPPLPERPAGPRPVAPPCQPEKMAARAVAPERHVNLSAMRELANLSAHSAIDRHALRQVRVAAWRKVLTTTVAIGASVILLRIWWTDQAGELTFSAALVTLLVALLWGLQSARLIGRKMRRKSRHADEKPGEDRNHAELNAAAQTEGALGQEVPSGDESNSPGEDSAPAWQQELKALIEAWPPR